MKKKIIFIILLLILLLANTDYTVYITETGEKYHTEHCRYLKKSKIPILKSEAIEAGYTPCKVCEP